MKRIGWSEFALFCRCPRQYQQSRRRQPGHLPMVVSESRERGRLLDAVVSAFYAHKYWQQPGAETLMYEALQAAAKDTPPALASQVAVAADAIPTILETARREQLVGPSAVVQYPVSLVVRDVSIEGRLDLLVTGLDHRKRLLDAKTGHVDRDQLRFYACALETTGFGAPEYLGFWHLRKGEVQWIKFTAAQRVKFLNRLDRDMRAWQMGWEADAAIPGSHCRYCPFTQDCDAYRERIREKQAAVPEVPPGGGTVSL